MLLLLTLNGYSRLLSFFMPALHLLFWQAIIAYLEHLNLHGGTLSVSFFMSSAFSLFTAILQPTPQYEPIEMQSLDLLQLLASLIAVNTFSAER